jgi:MFS family permease
VAAGLSLTTAAAYTGARGLAQLGGRLLLVPAVRRAGPVRVLVGTYFLGAAGVIALTWSAVPAAAVVATVLAGLAVGAAPPIDAVYSAEVFDPAGLGTLMGVQQLLAGVVLAVGPFAVGHAFDVTGSYSIGIVASAAGFAAAALIIGRVGALAAAERSDRSRSDEVH